MIMIRNQIGLRSHAQLFLVDSVVIEYKIHSLGHDVVFVVRAQIPRMQEIALPCDDYMGGLDMCHVSQKKLKRLQ